MCPLFNNVMLGTVPGAYHLPFFIIKTRSEDLIVHITEHKGFLKSFLLVGLFFVSYYKKMRTIVNVSCCFIV